MLLKIQKFLKNGMRIYTDIKHIIWEKKRLIKLKDMIQ